MNTLDFDATVEFVWNWVAQLNTYLAQNGWNARANPSAPRGLSDSTLNEIADHLFQMVLKAEHPHRVMRALDIHLQSLITTNRNPALPEVYTDPKVDRDGQKRYLWNKNKFCTIIEEEVSRIVSKFEGFQTLGEHHFAAAAQRKPTL